MWNILTLSILIHFIAGINSVDNSPFSAKRQPGNSISFYAEFSGEKQVTRYGNRCRHEVIGCIVENTNITQNDFHKAVEIINTKDILRQGLRDNVNQGVGSTGIKFNKRTQGLMNDLDPFSPVNSKITDENASNGTQGYTSYAFVSIDGLQLGDTIYIIYNSGMDTKRLFTQFVANKNNINSYGKMSLELPLGSDHRTSTILGLFIKFGDHFGNSKFENGTASYQIKILREVALPSPPSARPISKRRARKRS